MGANARRRHGAVDLTPKIGTPYNERAVPFVHDRTGIGHSSHRARKKLKGYADITTLSTPSEQLELDPKPFRIGRNRYTIADAQRVTDAEAEKLIFSPRKNYAQDEEAYLHLV